MKIKKLCCFFAICLLFVTGCSYNLQSNSSKDGNTVTISKKPYNDKAESTEEICRFILQAMQTNQNECEINIASEDLINADEWLKHFPGLEQIHCEYKKAGSGYNTVIKLSYWDNYAIAYAYKTQDTQYLNERQHKLYDKYIEVLNAYTSKSRSQCENELAIHDYLTDNIVYTAPEENTDSEYYAYSALINGKAVCSGYAECFKTFMDMLGIENTTVSGTAGSQQHIWNEVCLDGEWYHVDVTWDDPVNNEAKTVSHTYFNISDDDIKADHSWDNSQICYKQASGTKYSYASFAGLKAINSQKEFNSFLKNCVKNGSTYLEFTSTEDLDMNEALTLTNTALTYSYNKANLSKYSLYTVKISY